MLTGRLIYLITFTLFVLLLSGCKEETQKQSTIDSTSQVSENTIINSDTIKTEIKKDSIITEQSPTIKDTGKTNHGKKIKNDSTLNKKVGTQRILAYYFHPTARCVTCRNIEAYSIEAINEWEEKSGRKVVWKELNIEDSVNEHYVTEYNLEFSSLVIARFTGGRKDKWKNLEDTWKLVNDKKSFKKYVKFELNQFLKNN
ncbi:MAG: hypothetical protein HOP31_01120 [Ignavibacteria bacterium]|nr:hypothetical protein [Ignavibacteria bacterium]